MLETITTIFAGIGLTVASIVITTLTIQFANNASRNMSASNKAISENISKTG